MDSAELGRRLKSARLAKKMTQSDVAGTFITRNMLSLIESGNATPSVKTLEYLSSVLEIPMEKLLSESGEDHLLEQSHLQTLQNAKNFLSMQQYHELLQCTDKPEGLFADEFHAMRSIAYLELAYELARSSQTDILQNAVAYARSAAQEATIGIYANPARAAQANQLIANLAKYLSDYYSSLAQNSQ